jgi:Tfp pilus assembly protein PilF
MERLAGRALEVDEAYGNGSLQALHISLAMSQPWPQSRRLDAARQHFERAVLLSHGQQAAVFVTYAEAVAIPTGTRDEFERLLEQALRVDTDAAPEARLANALFQRRARWLRSHADQFFSQ